MYPQYNVSRSQLPTHFLKIFVKIVGSWLWDPVNFINNLNLNKISLFIQLCNEKKAAWLLKCNSLIRKSYIDDLEIDEEGIGDILLDENTVSQFARPGTSF